jgi:hypothetical protein
MTTYITSSVANTDGFIPSIWAQEALPILRSNVNLARFVAKDSDFGPDAFANVGQTLYVGYAGTMAPVLKSANSLLTAQVPTGGASASVTLDRYYVQPFVVENIAQAQSNQNLMQRFLEPAIAGLAEQVESDLFSKAYSFSPLSIGTIGTDMTSATIRDAQKRMNINKAPSSDRYLVMSPKDLAALEADSTLSNYFNFSAPGVVENGSFNRSLYGFTPVMSQLAPATAGSGHAVQTITLSGTASGSFTITYKAQTTASIAYGSTGASVEAKLQALSTVGVGMARVSPYDASGKVYTIVLYDASPAAMTTTDTTLTSTVADSTAVATSNVYLHKNAMILASRPVRPQGGSTVMSAQIYDDVSGLTLNLEAQHSIQSMGLWVNVSILYGVATLRADQGGVILA